ncbi:MAG TPA: hypothetical protein VE975_03250 [Actinomycetota bacterium]|jgi:hypothetical protein|nr:hypothetical protein [Actinomycetota bacterium]
MKIGKETEVIVVEPAEDPIPQSEPVAPTEPAEPVHSESKGDIRA